MPTLPAPPSPELLYLLAGDEEDLLAALREPPARGCRRGAATSCRPEAAASVVSALPFDLAVQVFDEPELDRRGDIIELLEERRAVPLIDAMSADQQADLFRELPEKDRARLLARRSSPTHATRLKLLLRISTGHGGRHHDDGVRLDAHDLDRASRRSSHIGEVGRRQGDGLRDLRASSPTRSARARRLAARAACCADREQTRRRGRRSARADHASRRSTDREEVARLISKYNLLAVPVVDDGRPRARHRHGRRRDRRDRPRADGRRAEVRRHGGARRAVHARSASGAMIRKRAGWLCALFLGEMLTATAMGHFEARDRAGGRAGAVHPADHQLRRQLGLAGDVAHHPRAWRCAR